MINENILELSKLNDEQRFKFDSINDVLFKYPRKTIYSINGVKEYNVAVANGLSLDFKVLDSWQIEEKRIKDLNVISVDSLLALFPGLYYLPIHDKSRDVGREFYIIEKDDGKAMKHRVAPFISIYD